MNEIQVFNSSAFGKLPIIEIDGKEYFGATEAAKALSFANPWDAIKNYVDKDDLADHEVIDSLGRKQSKKFVTEPGLYALIFGAARQGNNPEIKAKAKEFQKWVFDEVLPSIRKTGIYQVQTNVSMNDWYLIEDEKELREERKSKNARNYAMKLNAETRQMETRLKIAERVSDPVIRQRLINQLGQQMMEVM
ncbi:phage associated-antirepressor protein [Weissella oryzae SG25]|uniref:Phage associated-antirepressor protein n=1 Tax=Weissella oryzae (strain DSM 25784 / JCM 18191 / LMG 30913 / SG25) TaxID=1329250 RepID=A0A069CZA3_WEIOS|nr:BRO family protein [Weissella oryzae]GAK30396.1 phage associated-antirepressor protein [Weissella oryzae SG25]